MTDRLSAGALSNAGNTVATQKALFDQLTAFLAEQLASGAEQALTLASDAITPAAGASRCLSVDTQGGAGTDDLLSIVTTNVNDAGWVMIRNANTARTVVVKHSASPSAGQIVLNDGADFTLQDRKTWIILRRNGTTWDEVMRYEPLLGMQTVTTATNLTVTNTHRGKLIEVTAAATLNFTALATLGKGFVCDVICNGGAATLDPNGAEQINGAATLVMADGDWARVYVKADGSAFICKRPLMQGRQTIPVMAGAMRARATGGAVAGSIETATNKVNFETMDFADSASTILYAQFGIIMPKSWDEGPITYMGFWTTSSGGTATQVLRLALQAVAFGDNDVLDAAWGTAVEVTDALLSTTSTMHKTAESGPVTVGGSPGVEEYARFQVLRDPSGSDTLATTMKLLGLLLFVGINAGNDK